GLRVLDLADRPGALCGRLLAELGADVVLVEPPEGSPLRAIPPFWQGVRGAQRLLLVLRARQALDRGGAGASRAAPRACRRGDRDGPAGRWAGARRTPPAPRRRVDHALRAERALSRLARIGHGGAGDGRHARGKRPPRRPPAARARAAGLPPG